MTEEMMKRRGKTGRNHCLTLVWFIEFQVVGAGKEKVRVIEQGLRVEAPGPLLSVENAEER
jgi:hypothetical protein